MPAPHPERPTERPTERRPDPDAPQPHDTSAPVQVSAGTGPCGERVVVVGTGDDPVAHVTYPDQPDRVTDLSGTLADLLLLGWTECSTQDQDGHLAPPETVEVARVHLDGWIIYAVDDNAVPHRIDDADVSRWLSTALVHLITAGIAHDANDPAGTAHVPDHPPATLTPGADSNPEGDPS